MATETPLKNPWHGHPSVVVRSHCSNISKTAWPIKAKFHLMPPWVGGMKACLRYLGHMTKMATMPIYGKNPSNIGLLQNQIEDRFPRNLVCSIGDSSLS